MKITEKSTKYIIKMKALNFERFLNNAIQNNIKIENISRVENEVFFKIGKGDFNYLKETLSGSSEVEILKESGFNKILYWCRKRLGIIVGIMISIAIFFTFNSFVLNINIMGNEYISTQVILEKLKDVGVSKFKSSNFPASYVEDYLLDQIDDISMVSIKKFGTSVIVNIKEKLENNFGPKNNLTSQYNMLITNINVYSGTPNVKIGDIVKKGDILVYAYMEDGNGEIVNCEPMADIDADIWFTSRVEFKNQTIELVKTGRIETYTNYFLENIKIINNVKDCKFTNYKKEEIEYYLSDFLLPIRVQKVIYYELEEVTQDHDFEVEQDLLIGRCYEEAVNKVPIGLPIVSEDIEISQVQDGYIISVYLKSNIEIRSKTNED